MVERPARFGYLWLVVGAGGAGGFGGFCHLGAFFHLLVMLVFVGNPFTNKLVPYFPYISYIIYIVGMLVILLG